MVQCFLVAVAFSVGNDADRFNAEAPKAWERYAVRARRLQGKVDVTLRTIPGKQVFMDDRYEFKQRDGCCLYMKQNLVSQGKPYARGELNASNPHY
jgi:hypothetical protein